MDQFLNIRILDKDTGQWITRPIGDKATAEQVAANKISITQINNDIDEMKETDDALEKAVNNQEVFRKDINRRTTIAEERIATHTKQIDDLTAQTFLITQESDNITGLKNTSFRSGKILFLSGEFYIKGTLKAGSVIISLGKTAVKEKTLYFRHDKEWIPFIVNKNATISSVNDIDGSVYTKPIIFDCVVGRSE